MSPNEPLYCSFCRRDHFHVAKLVAGPGVHMCDRCHELAARAFGGEATSGFAGWESMDDEALLGSLGPAMVCADMVERSVGDQVRVLRERGISWARIGAAFGVSRQAAWQRWASAT